MSAVRSNFNQVRSLAVLRGSTECTRNDDYNKDKTDLDQWIPTITKTIVVDTSYVLFSFCKLLGPAQ